MTKTPIDDRTARELRRTWFAFLDTIEPHRAGLHRYAERLTGDVFEAEDLVQDTLLRGFGAIGRGDLHGEASRIRNVRAYLFRTASNLWIDGIRRARRDSLVRKAADGEAEVTEPGLASVADAAARLYAVASPQERAAVVLKDVFDYTNREIAELLDTSEGAVKAALHRGRARLIAPTPSLRHRPPSKALLDRFVAAFNARDAGALTACLLDTVSIEVQGVGGGRGREGVWVESSLRHARGPVEWRRLRDEPIILHLFDDSGRTTLDYVTRLEESDGAIARIRSYSYCPDTIAAVAHTYGLAARRGAYHQDATVLDRMIESTTLPWLP
jgi:RNA polymerase sigma-70 factor (ECF subfamily)